MAPSDAAFAGNYPFQESLYIAAIGGFENLWVDCKARGGSNAYCTDQYRIAQEFYDMGPIATNACRIAGFVPLPTPVCIGAQESAGCGAPTVQPLEACLPETPPAP